MGHPQDRIEKVARWIAATKHALAAPTGDSDLDWLLDFDLSVLASEPDIYDAYARAVREEYAFYPDLIYNAGRAKVLRGFLDAPTIYRTQELRRTWEEHARKNLAGELSRLL
jgi:predicted metal-dependent HD superfamily phosphohydrolase